MQSSPVATQAFDLDRNVTIWNAASERIFGWTADEVDRRPDADRDDAARRADAIAVPGSSER